jgi:hypothetical protein
MTFIADFLAEAMIFLANAIGGLAILIAMAIGHVTIGGFSDRV